MGSFSDLYSLIIMWSVGLICLIGLIILFVFIIIEFAKNKIIESPLLKSILTVIFIIGIILSLPYYLVAAAYKQDTLLQADKYLLWAKNLAIVPSVRANAYYEMSGNFRLQFKGKEAIESYENAVRISGKEDKLNKGIICFVYFWKPDRAKIIENCSLKTVAVDYTRTEEFEEALDTINESIEKSRTQKRTEQCFSYAVRAAIYKKMHNQSDFKKDYNKVKELCPGLTTAEAYMNADDIYDVYAGGREFGSKFKF